VDGSGLRVVDEGSVCGRGGIVAAWCRGGGAAHAVRLAGTGLLR
jgi:hypothetical protein